MASANSEAVRTLAKEIVGAMKTLTDSNNRNYVNNEIKNYRMTSSNIGTSLYADFARIAAAQISVAEIDTAQIRDLEATTIDTINLAAEKAKLGDVEVASLSSAIAQLGLTNIGTANIGYGQIKDLVAGTAIIREGTGGKLYIDRLDVTEANMVSLTVGELVVKGSDGNFYTFTVDSQGQVITELKQVTGTNIANNTISGTKIIENTITARELNVSQIFADQALINAIKASNIDVADLFASKAFAGTLYTNVIENPSIIIGDDGSHNVGTAIWSNTAPSDPEDGDTWVDTSALPYVFKEYQEDHWVSIGELSSVKSAINITEDRISLIIDPDSSTSTQLTLTEAMLLAIANKVNLMADTIDLSANHTITFNSDQLNAIARDIDLSSNHTITFNTSQLQAIANDINLSSNHTMTFNSTQLNQIATDIDLSANHTITFNAQQLEAIADDIDLTGNDTIRLNSTLLQQIAEEIEIDADRINVTGQDIDLSAANSITLSAGQRKSLGSSIDISENGSITLIAGIASAAQEDIDNLQIGGRNYLRNSRSLLDAELIPTDGVYQTGDQLHVVSGVVVNKSGGTMHIS